MARLYRMPPSGAAPGALGGGRHRVRCDACRAEAPVLDATDLPLDWAAALAGGRVVHACSDCLVPPLSVRRSRRRP